MKKPITLVAALVLVIGFPFGQVVVGQDFGQLLDAVDKLEASLKQLVEKESAARSEEVDKLWAELEKLRQARSSPGDRRELADLRNLVDQLNQKFNNLPAANAASVNEADLVSILNDVEFLKAENLYLRGLIEHNQKQLASTDEVGYTLATNANPNEPPQANIENIPAGLDITGFFDVIGSHQSSADDETDFGLGQAELDLEHQLYERAAASVAIAFNNEAASFELGEALIDINLYSNENRFLTSAGVIAGQFDVPFGLDWIVYGSNDRKMITAPWFADIHGGWRGWNDFGVQFLAESKLGNFVGYWVNGFEESAEVTTRILNLTTGLEEDTVVEVNITPANAFGTRVGITPISNLEVGGSFAIGFNKSGRDEMTLTGADVQYSLSHLELKGEYIYHSVNHTIEKESHQGYYFQATYGLLDKAFLISRYASFKPFKEDWIGQLSLAAGYAVFEGVEIRFEKVINEDINNNANILQLVVEF